MYPQIAVSLDKVNISLLDPIKECAVFSDPIQVHKRSKNFIRELKHKNIWN